MQALRIKLETVTPLFLGGAKPRGSPEIRAPSVRGALRYWLRAALGESNLSALKTSEAQVFGDTKDASAIVVRAHSEEQSFNYFERRSEPRRDDPRKKRWVPVHGETKATSYLFFSLDGNSKEKIKARWCYPVGADIELALIARRKDDVAWQRACASLWLLTRLGGIGARARRGAGGLQFKADQQLMHWPNHLPALNIRARSASELATELGDDLTKLRRVFEPDESMTAPAEFDTLAPDACQIWILSPKNDWTSWSAALGAVAKALRKGRSILSPRQLDAIKLAVDNKRRLPAIGRAGLGLPIVFFDKETGSNVGTLQGDVIERRGSPLHIRVVRLNTAPITFAVILTMFQARFAPARSELALKSEDKTLMGDLPDPDWIEHEFLPEFVKHSGARRLEVRFR